MLRAEADPHSGMPEAAPTEAAGLDVISSYLRTLSRSFENAYCAGADLEAIAGRDLDDDDQVALFEWFLANRSASASGKVCTPDPSSTIRCAR